METTIDSEKIRHLIAESVYKQDHIAASIGIKPSSLRQLKNGHYKPSLTVIKMLAIFFNVPETELYKKAA